jgi:hypothetical protein
MGDLVYTYLYHAINGVKQEFYYNKDSIKKEKLDEVLKDANFKFGIDHTNIFELENFIPIIEKNITDCKFTINKYNSLNAVEESFDIIIRNGTMKKRYTLISFTEEEENEIEEKYSRIQLYFEHLEAIKICNMYDKQVIQDLAKNNLDLVNIHASLLRDELLFLDIRRNVTEFPYMEIHKFDVYRDVLIFLYGNLDYYKDLEEITFLPCEHFIYDFIKGLMREELINSEFSHFNHEDCIEYFLPPLLIQTIQQIDFVERSKIFYELKNLYGITDMKAYFLVTH